MPGFNPFDDSGEEAPVVVPFGPAPLVAAALLIAVAAAALWWFTRDGSSGAPAQGFAPAASLTEVGPPPPTLVPWPTFTPTPRPTPPPPPPPGMRITNAIALRDQLLEAAKGQPAGSALSFDGFPLFGVPGAWLAKFPQLRTTRGAANPNAVSLRTTFVHNAALEPSADNPYVIVFAVEDASGRCAAGGISGYPAPTIFIPVALADTTECSAFGVVDQYVGR